MSGSTGWSAAFFAVAMLAGCSAGDTTDEAGDGSAGKKTGLRAVAVLEPGGTVLEDYVEWAVFPGYVAQDGAAPEFSNSGTPYKTAKLDVSLAPGHYRVEAESSRLESRVDVEITEGEIVDLTVPLEGTLLVVDPVSEGGVSGELVRPNGRGTVFGSSSGTQVISVEPGEHEITLRHGVTRLKQTVDIEAGTVTVLEPDLSVGTLKGSFDFADGDEGFSLDWNVREWDSDSEKPGESLARELGKEFELRLPPGEYWVRGAASGMLAGTARVTVSAGETTDHTLSLPYTYLRATLVDDAGEEIREGFYWWLLDADNLDDKPWEVKKPGDEFLMALPEDVEYILAARDNDSKEFVAMSDRLEFEDGEALEIQLQR